MFNLKINTYFKYSVIVLEKPKSFLIVLCEIQTDWQLKTPNQLQEHVIGKLHLSVR